MVSRGRIWIGMGLVAFAATWAGITDTFNGTLDIGSTSNDIAGEIEANWSAGDDYTCRTDGNVLTVTVVPNTPNAGACLGRRLRSRFELTSGPMTTLEHDFGYQVTCDMGRLRHSIGFDAAAADPNDFTAINEGTFMFVLGQPAPGFSGGPDELTIVTTEGPTHVVTQDATTRIPALGEWGAIVLGAAVLGLGVLLILRRTGSAAAS